MNSNMRNGFAGWEVGRREFLDFSLCEALYRPNQIIPQHSHDLTYISIVIKGSYTERFEATSTEISVGQVIFHRAGEWHSNRFHNNGGRVLNLEFLPSFINRLTESRGLPANRRSVLKTSYALQLGLRLYREFSAVDATSSLAVEGLTMELMAEIFRNHIPQAKPKGYDWLDRVMEILNDKYNERITLDEIASVVSVHPVHLARAFRKRYLCSVGDHIRKLRIEAACRDLMNSNISIAEIALRTGFSDQSHLSRAIKQNVGMSPRSFRQRHVRS